MFGSSGQMATSFHSTLIMVRFSDIVSFQNIIMGHSGFSRNNPRNMHASLKLSHISGKLSEWESSKSCKIPYKPL